MKLMTTALPSLVAFTLFFAYAQAQVPDSVQRKVDSLKAMLPGDTPEDKYRLNYQMGYELFDLDNYEAVAFMETAFHTAKEIGDSTEIVHSGRLYGQLLRRVEKNKNAIAQLEYCIPIAERNDLKDELRNLYNSIAIAYTLNGVYDKALEQNFKSLALRELTGDSSSIAISLGNIGLSFYMLGIFDESRKYLQKSLALDPNSTFASENAITLGLCLGREHQYDRSKTLLDSIQNAFHGKLSEYQMARVKYGYGIIQIALGSTNKAKSLFQESVALARQSKMKNVEADALLKLAETYKILHKYDSAEILLLNAAQLATKMGYKNASESIYVQLSSLYLEIGDDRKASSAMRRLIILKDSIINRSVVEKISRIQLNYAQKENSKIIKNQEASLQNSAGVIEYQRYIIALSLLAFILLSGVAILLIRINRFRQTVSLQLKQRVEERTTELKSYSANLHQLEVEKNIILENIARRLSSALATFRGIEIVAKTYESVPADFASNIRSAGDGLDEILKSVRSEPKP